MSDVYASVFARFHETLFGEFGYNPPAPVMLAFSGGADSSLLLRFLLEASIPVTAVHVHHGIRGQEADRDEAFCRSVCREMNVSFLSFHINVPSLAAERGKGIEETAREARYECLEAARVKYGIPYLMTAHHADDNLETVLFRLIRGTGLPGLCGIPPCRGPILRPLLTCEKKDILQACREKNIPFVTDSTNDDLSSTRNFLRHEIIPRLETLNPALVSRVTGMTQQLRRDEAYLNDEAEKYSFSDGRAVLSRLPDAVLSRVLLREMRGAGLSPEFEHIEAAMRFLRSGSVRRRLSCPGGTVIVDRGRITATQSGSEPVPIPEKAIGFGLTELNDDSAFYLGAPEGTSAKDINMLKNIYKFAIQETVDSAKIETVSLYVRGRLPGDVYRLGGMTRSVRKMLQSKKSGLRERSSLPFLMAGGEILWIPGFPVSDEFRPGQNGKPLLLYYFCKKATND